MMSTTTRWWLTAAALAACALARAQELGSVELDPAAIRAEAERLLAIPSRAAGLPGGERAAEEIAARLKALRLEPITVGHPVTVPVDHGTTLTIDGAPVHVVPHLPNGFATPGTGGETITAPIVWLGDGEIERFAGKDLKGAIAAFDAGSHAGWRYAAQLGARAALFRRTGKRAVYDLAHEYLWASGEFPRALADIGPEHDGKPATFASRVTLEPATAWSVLARISGTGRKGEAVVLTTAYESPTGLASECQGATEAWNAAMLLEIAAKLAADPPKRDVIVLFHGARGEWAKGMREVLGALTVDRDAQNNFAADGQLDTARKALIEEAWRCRRVAAAVAVARLMPTGAFAPPAAGLLPTIEQLAAGSAAWPLPAGALNADDEPAASKKLVDDLVRLAASEQVDAASDPLLEARERWSRRGALQLADDDIASLQAQIKRLEAQYDRYRDIPQKLEFDKELNAAEDRQVVSLLARIAEHLERQTAITDRRRADMDSLAAARGACADTAVIHLIALDFTDGGDRFSCLTGGAWVNWTNELSWLPSGLMRLAKDVSEDRRGEPPVPFDRMPYDMPGDFKAYFPSGGSLEAGIAAVFPLTAAALATTNDLAEKVGTMLDTGAAFRAEPFLKQTVGLRDFLRAYIDDTTLLGSRKPKGIVIKSPWVRTEIRTIGGKTGKRPYPYALATMGMGSVFAGPYAMSETAWCDAFGAAQCLFLPQGDPGAWKWPVNVYGFDAAGRIDHVIATKGRMGGAEKNFEIGGKIDDVLPLVFPCVQSRLYGVFDPRLLRPLNAFGVLSASRDADPNDLHIEWDPMCSSVVAFTGPRDRLRFIAAEGSGTNQMVITGPLKAEPGKKVGLAPGDLAAGLTALDAAHDMVHLNDERVTLLRQNGISSDSLVTLHSQSQRRLKEAEDAFKAKDYQGALGRAQAAWSLAGRVYPALLSTANDVVYGLVVMLMFAIPFALICERLFLAGNTILKKVAGFTAFFSATFLFFFFFHPAFRLATTPMIIFLAFVILIMSIWVSSIVYNRFEHEMEQIRNARLGIHKADVSRLGTIFATVALGISNMRRRPLRTFLTGLTVVLMTFILLTFASFTTNAGAQRLAMDAKPPFDGLMLRRPSWTHLSESLVERVRASWGDRFDLYPTRWLDPTWFAPKYPLTGPKGSTAIGGLAGFIDGDPTGIERALMHAPDEPLKSRGYRGEKDWLFLPPDVVERLGLTVGGTGRFWGRDLRIGLIDTKMLGALSQLSGEALTPLAPEAMDDARKKQAQEMAEAVAKGAMMPESTSYTHLSPNNVGIVHASLIESLQTGLVAVTLVPKDKHVDIDEAGEDMAQQLALTIRVASRGDGYLLTAVGKLDVAGLGAVLVPLILGGLIIFSTMLNSVAERGKEIFIYSSLGLAPIHVAALFLVEASIYAVLGGLGGYMVAQLIAKALGVLATFGLATQPDLNYSSFTAVTTILLVMVTVLLSALYPALIASRAANPGTSDFKVPHPDGDKLAIDFPFTVSRRDIRGLLAYLAAYFEAHTEASTGCFTAADAAMTADGERFSVATKTWLAPFDLGISQKLVMSAVPTDVKAIYAVHLDLELLSGQRRAWRRANLAFLAELRQQFLVWRTLSAEAMDKYRALGGDPEAKARLSESTNQLKKDVEQMGVVT